jgi:protein TonB
MFANFATAVSTGTAITLVLVYLMNLLIAIQPGATVNTVERHPITWDGRSTDDTRPKTIEFEITKEFIAPPIAPTRTTFGDSDAISVNHPRPSPPPVKKFSGTGIVMYDGPPVALVRISPTYPARAQQLGLEGWVLVQFDVLASGTVANVAVVESSNRLFERSAVNAAQRFRYKARVIDGVPTGTTGVQNLFTFRMED